MRDLMGQELEAGMHVFRGDCYTHSHRLGWVLKTLPGDGTSWSEDKVKVSWQIDGGCYLLFRQPWISDRSYFRISHLPSAYEKTTTVKSSTVIRVTPEVFHQAQNRARAVAHIEKNQEHFARMDEPTILNVLDDLTKYPETIPL